MPHISKCFNQSLTNIQSQAKKLQELNEIVLDYLPSEMQSHCHIGGFNNGCLVLTVDDAVWASQLRFLIPEIRDNLRKNNNIYQLSSIKITIDRNKTVKRTKKNFSQPLKISPWKAILELLRSK